jgi:hypothetical protein
MKPVSLTFPAALAALALVFTGSSLAQVPDRTSPDTRPPGKPPASNVMYLCPGAQDFTARFS